MSDVRRAARSGSRRARARRLLLRRGRRLLRRQLADAARSHAVASRRLRPLRRRLAREHARAGTGGGRGAARALRPRRARRPARRGRGRRCGRNRPLARSRSARDRRHRCGTATGAATRPRRGGNRGAAARRRLAALVPRLPARLCPARAAPQRGTALSRMRLRLGRRHDRRADRRRHARRRRARRLPAADGSAPRRPRARARRHRPAPAREPRHRGRRRRARLPRARPAHACRARRGARAARRRNRGGARLRRSRHRPAPASPPCHRLDARSMPMRPVGGSTIDGGTSLHTRGNDEEALPPAAPAGCDRCCGRRGRARVDDAGRGRDSPVRNADADPASGRDLPGERLLRPLLRHVPERGEHGRIAVRRGAAHAGGRRFHAGNEPVAASRPAARLRPDGDESEFVAADPPRYERELDRAGTGTASSRATRTTTTATSSRPWTAA